MKKSFVIFTLVCSGLFAKAQTTDSSPVFLGFGGFPDGKLASGNLTLELRGTPASAPYFSAGLRIQLAVANGVVYTSLCVAGDYYFLRPEHGLRIFAGIGIGGFNQVRGDSTFHNNVFNLNNSNFGFSPRLGIEYWRFRLSGEYDFTGGSNNYAAVNLSFLFGGGRKKQMLSTLKR